MAAGSWTGAKDQNGYGKFNAGGGRANAKYVRAYRWAYERLVGPIPDGYVIDHLCFNPGCVNPAHLRAVTQQANSQNRNGLNRRNTSGYWGVSGTRNGTFRAYINLRDRQVHLGTFATAEEAAEVAAAARAEHFDLPAVAIRRRDAA